MRVFIRTIGLSLAALSIVGAGALGFMINDRTPPISYEGAGAMSPSVPAGGTIEVEFKVYRDRICQALAKRYLLDASGTKFAIPSYTVGLSTFVGRETYRRKIEIPAAAAVGPAQYQVELEYYCNPIHRLGWPIMVNTPVVNFEITPSASLVPFGLPSQPDG